MTVHVLLNAHTIASGCSCYWPSQSIRELDYVVKDKLFLEKVLGMEFYDAMDRSLFYNGKKFPSH